MGIENHWETLNNQYSRKHYIPGIIAFKDLAIDETTIELVLSDSNSHYLFEDIAMKYLIHSGYVPEIITEQMIDLIKTNIQVNIIKFKSTRYDYNYSEIIKFVLKKFICPLGVVKI